MDNRNKTDQLGLSPHLQNQDIEITVDFIIRFYLHLFIIIFKNSLIGYGLDCLPR